MSSPAPSAEGGQPVVLHPIGVVRTGATALPRHWSVSDVEGTLEIRPEFVRGLEGVEAGKRIVVLFHFDRSPAFTADRLVQMPPHLGSVKKGVFGICSPIRPNPIGLSVLDGTPILDLKPHVEGR